MLVCFSIQSKASLWREECSLRYLSAGDSIFIRFVAAPCLQENQGRGAFRVEYSQSCVPYAFGGHRLDRLNVLPVREYGSQRHEAFPHREALGLTVVGADGELAEELLFRGLQLDGGIFLVLHLPDNLPDRIQTFFQVASLAPETDCHYA